MKKTVKVSDIRKISKMFNLSEDEQYWLNDVSNDINEERGKSKYCTQLSFILSPYCHIENKDRYHAICSLIIYFGLKVQEEIGTLFNETIQELSNILNADPQWITRYIKGMSYSNPRWDKRVYVADQCGLNVLELTK